jgi:Ca2+-binding RTX toxin-like protein
MGVVALTPAIALAQSTYCAGDTGKPLDCAGTSGAANCYLGSLYALNDRMDCDFNAGSRSTGASVTAIYLAPGSGHPDEELHVYGTDEEGDAFCCIEELTTAGGANWNLFINGADGYDDTVAFDDGTYTLASYDETVSTVWVQVLGNGGDDDITCPLNNVANHCVVAGGPGNDTLTAGPLWAQLWGGAGEDVITGGDSADHIDGGPDADIIDAGLGNDLVCAGASSGGPFDAVDGGGGDDRIWGGDSSLPGDAVIDGSNGTDQCAGAGSTTGCEIFTLPIAAFGFCL